MKKNVYEMLHTLDGRPPLSLAIPLGMQHVLAMFVGNLTPLLVVGNTFIRQGGNIDLGYLSQSAMVLAGICTLIQLYKVGPIGSGLPVVMGTSSAFIGVNTSIVTSFGWTGLMGASLIGALFELVIGFFTKYVKKLFPPLVTGITVLTIGITLIPIGVNNFLGGGNPLINPNFGSFQNIFLGSLVLILTIILKLCFKGLISLASMFFAIIIGYIVSFIMGMSNFDAVLNAGWFSIPTPFKYGMTFHAEAIVPMLFLFIVTAIETIGDTTGVAQGGLNREATVKELRGTVLADGVSSCLAAIFMVSPLTSFSQNVGLVRMTKVVNRFAISMGAIFLVIAGFIPKIGSFFAGIPSSVLGGAVLLMFASIAVTGISLIKSVDLNSKNTLIIATSLGIGVGFGQSVSFISLEHIPYFVKLIFSSSGLAASAIIALTLNLILPDKKD